MKSVYTYGLQKTRRNLTLPDILVNKAAGKKITQATAVNGEEAAAVQATGIDKVGLVSAKFEEARAVPEIYMIAAIEPKTAIDTDDVLRETFRSTMAGTSQIYTIRSWDIVEKLVKDGFFVHGHVVLEPRKSVRSGGLRTMGRAADEAITILEVLRRQEDASAVAVEVECVAKEATTALSQNTSLVTHDIGSGQGAYVIFLFTEDCCSEAIDPPRHARAFCDIKSLHHAVAEERVRGIKAYQAAVTDGSLPDEAVITKMKPGEVDKLAEALARRPNNN